MSATTTTTVGTITLPAATVQRANYETAAWYTTFEYEAQTVEVEMGRDGSCRYTIVGRTTYEYFPALFGGVATGGGTIGECDKPATISVSLYGYTAAAMVEDGTIELADGFEIAERYHDHPVSCQGFERTDEGYVPCEHDHHDGPSGRVFTERSDRGFLPFGYVPGVVDTKRHIRIVAA